MRSKNDGENLAKALNNKFDSNIAAFICSESKNNTRGSQAIYDEILKLRRPLRPAIPNKIKASAQ